MKAQLYNEPPLTFSPTLAAAVGLNEAIILQQINYWIQINKDNKRNCVDGHYWVYRSYSDWKRDFPFWCVGTIRNTITKLENSGFLLSGNYNKIPMDKTKWYTINYDELFRHIAKYEAEQEKTAAV